MAVYFTMDFESVTVGQLPAGWTGTSANGGTAADVRTTQAHAGTKSLETQTNVTNNAESGAYFNQAVTAGDKISFWWYGDSEGGFDFLRFLVDDVIQASLIVVATGPPFWQEYEYTFPTTKTVKIAWNYDKDGSVNQGTDDYWIDDITIGSFPLITDMGDEDFVEGETSVTITGTGFGSVEGQVHIGDSPTKASSTVLVQQVVTLWTDTSITITISIGNLPAGISVYAVVTHDDATESSGYAVVLHRAAVFRLAASANIPVSGADTTFQLAAPMGKTTGDFEGGRIQDDENPGDAVTIVGKDGYREDEWALEPTDKILEGGVYEFRVLIDGQTQFTYTLYPQWTHVVSSDQEGFVWRDDDGNEVSATNLDAQDTSVSRKMGETTRVRVLTDYEGNPDADQLTVQWRKVGDPVSEWEDVT